MMGRSRIVGFAISAALLIGASNQSAVRIAPEAPIIVGETPGIVVSGLNPGQPARVHGFGAYQRWEKNAAGQWAPVVAVYHSWADVLPDATGRVDMDRADVASGTYHGIDGYGLLWSMRKPTDPILADAGPATIPASVPLGTTRIIVSQLGQVVGDALLRYREAPGLTVEPVADGALNGIFAAPKGKTRLPTIILLHGSEGGGVATARALATQFAGQGYAAFALNYFAWDFEGLKGVPNIHVNQPIELIDRVRGWLSQRAEVDPHRIGLYGHSKGAEYAEVAAVRYPWVKAVIACVGTDVVWEGYGIGDERAALPKDFIKPREIASWSWRGKPLPYVRLQPWRGGIWFDNTARYEAGRVADPEAASAAAIPIERSHARWLLIGSLRDEIWASGAMSQRLADRLRRAGKGDRVSLLVHDRAGHQVCGSGLNPSYVWADPSTDPRVKDPGAEGSAAVQSWQAMKAFLARAL